MSDTKNRIIKTTKNVFESAKDNTIKNLIGASSAGSIKIDRSSLTEIIKVINISMDESFLKSSRVYEKELNTILDASSDQSTPVLAKKN